MKLVVVVLCACAFVEPALAQTGPGIAIQSRHCYRDAIQSVSNSGSIVQTMSGSIFKIDEFDRFDTQMWLPTESLLVCVTTGAVTTGPMRGQALSTYDLIDLDSDDGDTIWADKLQ